MENKIVWVEISVKDLKRACEFYSNLMNLEIKIEKHDGKEFAVCPHKDNEVAFSLSAVKDFKPYDHEINPLIYLNVNRRLDEALELVTKHGGKILTGKESIGPYGFKAVILDSEGNRVGLHSF